MKDFIEQNSHSPLSVFQDFTALHVELITFHLQILLIFDKDLHTIIHIKQKSKDQKY